MALNKIRGILIVFSIALVIIVLGLSASLNVASFKKNYTESLVANYNIAGAEPVRKIEYAIKYGKTLTNFYGIDDLLLETQQVFPEILDVRIILPTGEIAYSLNGNEKGNVISEKIKKTAFSSGNFISGKNYINTGNKYDILIPIKDKEKDQIGSLDMVLDNSTINTKIINYYSKVILYLLVITIISIILILLLFNLVPLIRADGEIITKRLILILISILGVTQLVFGLLNYNLFKNIYIETSKENTSMVVKVVQSDMNSVIQKGVLVTELNGIENWLNLIVQSVPEIDSLYITNVRGEVFYKTKNLILMQEELIDPLYNYSLPLIKDSMSQKGLVNLVLSKKNIEKKLTDVELDALTVLLVSFIFLSEMEILLFLFLKRKRSANEPKLGINDDEITRLKLIRPVVFGVLIALSICTGIKVIGTLTAVLIIVYLLIKSKIKVKLTVNRSVEM